jgi:hypothetical protein
MTDISTWEKVAAIATAVGGLGAMIGAIAAWRAAHASGQAARDAKDALAASLKPQVQLILNQYGGAAAVARAVVVGPLSPAGLAGVFPAADVTLHVNLASGRQESAFIPILEPNGSRWAQEPPYLNVVLGGPSDDWPPSGGDHAIVTVTYSDIRGAASYRLSKSVDLRRSADNPMAISFQNLTEHPETRLTP